MTRCKICAAESMRFAEAKVLKRYDVKYFRCAQCGFIQTGSPHWLDEAYEQSISQSDVGLVSRNIKIAKRLRVLIPVLFDPDGKFLDYGGGHGLLVRLMRDAGFDFFLWDRFTPNLFATGVGGELNGEEEYELITAIEVFEHLRDPLQDIGRILDASDSVLFSTKLVPADTPKPGEWSYYATETGQHISFYSEQSLRWLAREFNCNFVTNGNTYHLLTRKKVRPCVFRWLQKECVVSLLGLLPGRRSLLTEDHSRITAQN